MCRVKSSCAENVLKLGPFQPSPIHSGPFAWSRSLECLDLRHLNSLVQIVN